MSKMALTFQSSNSPHTRTTPVRITSNPAGRPDEPHPQRLMRIEWIADRSADLHGLPFRGVAAVGLLPIGAVELVQIVRDALELARSQYVARRENIIAVGNSGTGKTHIALGLGLAACQKGLSVGFITAAALVHELIEARDEKRLLRLQRQVAGYKLLIIDELGYVPLSQTGAELLFEVFSQRYERGSTIVTSNLPFDEWTGVFASERLTGALLDRLTHHVHILEMNGDSYRLKQSKRRSRSPDDAQPAETPQA